MKKIILKGHNKYQLFVKILKILYKLTEKEEVIYSCLLEKYDEYKEKIDNNSIINELLFSSKSYKDIRNKTKLSSQNFNFYKKSLIKKGLITDKGLAITYTNQITFIIDEKQ